MWSDKKCRIVSKCKNKSHKMEKKSHLQMDTFSHFNICHNIWNGFRLGRKTFDTEQFYVNNLTNFSWKDLENSFKQKPLSFFSESNSFYVYISIRVSSTARTKKCLQFIIEKANFICRWKYVWWYSVGICKYKPGYKSHDQL